MFSQNRKGRLMRSIRFRPRRSRPHFMPASVAAAALCAFPAFAGDKPATPEGAKHLEALFARFWPAAEAGASPLVAVTPEGSSYRITADLSALNGLLKEAGASYDPATLVYKATEQDDGKWRISTDSLPRIVFHSKKANGSVEFANFNFAGLIDPAVAWFLNGSASADKGAVQIQTPKVDQSIDFGAVQENITTNVNGDGSISTLVKEDIADIGLKATGVGEDDARVNFSGRADKALISVGLDGFKSRKAFDLWSLMAAHPTRADLADHEAELKSLLKELAAPGMKITEGVEAHKGVVTASIGAIALADLKYQLSAANAGPQSSISFSVSAEGLSLPVGLVPPAAGDLTPSKIEVSASFKGIDLAAGASEAIADMRLQGDGPLISEEDAAKVEAALLSADPVRIEFAPSHIQAPALDADFVGVVRYEHGRVSAAMTIHMRGFDKTMAAVKAMGPDIMAKAMPMLALAKGLGKSESDGSLSWVVELDADRSMKVNGIPFGKAPK
jgi:hypothetical protein